MATKTNTTPEQTPATPKAPKAKRAPVDLIARMKTQLSTAAIKSKVTVEQLEALESHLTKLKALLA